MEEGTMSAVLKLDLKHEIFKCHLCGSETVVEVPYIACLKTEGFSENHTNPNTGDPCSGNYFPQTKE